jgi:hypothetical protein
MRSPGPTDPFVRLDDAGYTMLVLRDSEEVYYSYMNGVRPLLELVDWFPGGLYGATVVDRVVGGCAARVFAHLQVGRVLGVTGSISAESILHTHGIEYRFRHLVADIRNRDDTGTCPFELLSREHAHAAELLAAMRDRLTQLRAAASK